MSLPKTAHSVFQSQIETERLARDVGDEEMVEKARRKQREIIKSAVEGKGIRVDVSGMRDFDYTVEY